MLKIGDKAPDFAAESSLNHTISLSALGGKKVVLYFYPKDSTPGCTLEARDFEKLQDQFIAKNAVILGVSKDSIKSHDKFATKECLTFDLLSDESGEICEKYEVWIEKSMYGKKYMGINRSTFLIDEAGLIMKIWSAVSVTGHATDVLSNL